jgi:hypothetical protein
LRRNARLMKQSRQSNTSQTVADDSPPAQAQAQLKNIARDQFAAAITDFIEWRAFAYWVRLVHEHGGSDACRLDSVLAERCPQFLPSEAAYHDAHPCESSFRWLRLIEWLDSHVFHQTESEGWRHALGYYAARDERLDRIRAYWLECDETWKREVPGRFPDFEEWREAALAAR